MKLVQHLLDIKGADIVTIDEGASVFDAIKLMADHSIGSLLVMRGQNLKGIVTELQIALGDRNLWALENPLFL